MSKEPPTPQPHLWDGTPMAAMPYVISKGNDTPVHRVYEGMKMSEKTMKCYSTDDETYNHADDFGGFIDSIDGAEVGQTYYVAECKTLEPTEPINQFTVGHILEQFDEAIYEEIGEVYDNECSDVDGAAKLELRELLEAWARKHLKLGRYFKIIGKSQAVQFTAEELP